MKGLKAVARASKGCRWLPLYYSITQQKAFTEDGEGRSLVTYLIRENTEKEIENAVVRWLNM